MVPGDTGERSTGDALTGRVLGDFVVKDKLGEGGFGTVYRAEQPLLARDAVIKTLQMRTRASPEVVQRFLREARLASALDHPYAAHIYAFGAEPDGLLWIAMERVRGTPLDQLLAAQGTIPLERFVPLLERLCEVVQSAHDQGIIHRDLKPANVMVLARAGRLLPKLLDLGIAKLESEDGGGAPAPAGPPATDDGDEAAGAAGLDLGRAVSVHITQRGLSIGSPPYMAPEQWRNAASADARTDLYALGVLSYQALTGKLPFEGGSLPAIARAHAQKPVPPLGAGFPAELDQALGRALAKRPADRFASALDFAAAFRAAAGLAAEPEQVPQLEDAVRELVIAEAPQPLAETVATLEAARSLGQAHDALWQAFDAAVRFVGVLALACRTRVGPGAERDAPPVTAALIKLRHGILTDGEWGAFARELCRPFARRRDAHPLPELVAFFFAPGGDEPGPGTAPLDALAALRAAGPPAGAGEAALREHLARALPELARLLRALTFTCEYPLVVRRGARVERWMGVRRTRRGTMPARDEALVDGHPALFDPQGNPVVSLWPLVQMLAPTPGAAEEVFVLEGKGRLGARLVALPLGFERQDEALWEWYRARLLDADAGAAADAAAAAAAERTPYLGLSAFTASDSDNFFGREREAEAFANRLRVQPLLAVVGPSGAGKSSFVQAGVVPTLPPRWRTLTVRPGATPFAALAARLAQEGILGHPSAGVADDPDTLGDRCRETAARAGETLVIVIDQFEELLTLCLDAGERQRYAEALARAARSADDPVRVVITLRDDFLIRAQQLPAFRDRLAQGLQLLATPAEADLLRILVEPARRAGFDFEDRQLPTEMVQAVVDQPGALALLSFTASKLWEVRDRHFHRFTRRAYQALGGVGGALAQHAEVTLAELGGAEQKLCREAFRHLVTADGTRAVLSRSELAQVLRASAPSRPEAVEVVVERLVSARLLVSSEGEGSEDRVEVIHEALLSSWPRLVKWQREDAEGARLRDQLRAAARQWHDRGRNRGMVWRGEALLEYRLWRSRYPGTLTETEEAFAAASLAEDARSRRRRRVALASTFTLLAAGLVVLYGMNGRAVRSAEESQRRLVGLYAEQGRQELLAGRSLRALVYLSQAYSQGGASPSLQFLLARSITALDQQAASLEGHTQKLRAVAFFPDGTRLVTGSEDGTARVWDARTGRTAHVLEGHNGRVEAVAVSQDGTRVLTASADKTARLWDAASGALVATLAGHGDRLTSCALSPDGRRAVTGSEDHDARLWDAAGHPLAVLTGHQDRVTAVALGPDGTRVLTASADKTARIWDAATGASLAVLAGHEAVVNTARYGAGGARVITASDDATAKVWDAADGALVATLSGHAAEVWSAELSPDGTRAVTASKDKTARIWALASGKAVFVLEGHRSWVRTVAYSPDGARILTGSMDATGRLWDAHNGKPLAALEGHTAEVWTAAFSPDGTRVVTASFDRTAKLWRADSTVRVATLTGHLGEVRWAEFGPDGQQIVTAGADRTVRLWDRATGTVLRTFTGPAGAVWSASFSPDGRRLVAGAEDATARVWDLTSGRELVSLSGHGATVYRAAFHPDGTRIVTSSEDGTARLWDAASGRALRTFAGHTAAIWSVAFSPDGARLATGSDDQSVRIWDVETGRSIRTFTGLDSAANAVGWSPDGRRLVVGTGDGGARILDTGSGRLLVSLDGHVDLVATAELSRDGRRVLTSGFDGVASLWDAVTGKLLTSLDGHTGNLYSARYAADGESIVTAGADGTAKIWRVPIERRSATEILRVVTCRVPYRLDQGRLLPASRPPECVPGYNK